MGDDELEQELRPGGGADLARPVRQRMAVNQADERLLPERAVHQHRLAAVGSQRQQALLGFAVEQVVGELHEVERLALHQRFHGIVAAAVGSGDA